MERKKGARADVNIMSETRPNLEIAHFPMTKLPNPCIIRVNGTDLISRPFFDLYILALADVLMHLWSPATFDSYPCRFIPCSSASPDCTLRVAFLASCCATDFQLDLNSFSSLC